MKNLLILVLLIIVTNASADTIKIMNMKTSEVKTYMPVFKNNSFQIPTDFLKAEVSSCFISRTDIGKGKYALGTTCVNENRKFTTAINCPDVVTLSSMMVSDTKGGLFTILVGCD